MRNAMRIIFALGVALILIGLVAVMNGNHNIFNRDYTRFEPGHGGMMFNRKEIKDSGEKINVDELEKYVDKYIGQFNEKLVIGDIFIYEDSDYYFSIMEEETGLGAMELLVNPYTGDIHPEFGPNMMWNLKYGMHGGMGYGMMRSNEYNYSSNFEGNTISPEDAHDIAVKYVESNYSDEYSVPSDFHEFYGYYTFHIEKDDRDVAMFSVNGLTGEVWFHDWHGTVSEVIEDNHD